MKEYHKSNHRLVKNKYIRFCKVKGCNNTFETPFKHSMNCGQHKPKGYIRGKAKICNSLKKVIKC